MNFGPWLFYILAAIAVISGVLVITRRQAVHSVLFLVVCFFALAGIYLTLGAEFLAGVQILVYTGGILVLFLFVIMLVGVQKVSMKPRAALYYIATVVAIALLAGGLSFAIHAGQSVFPDSAFSQADAGGVGNTEEVGLALYRDFLLPFEVASVLLLVAMIGAITLARRKL